MTSNKRKFAVRYALKYHSQPSPKTLLTVIPTGDLLLSFSSLTSTFLFSFLLFPFFGGFPPSKT